MWQPRIDPELRPRYRAIAETLGEDISTGRLQPGERLPPVRALAAGLGVTPGTVHRAYAQAESRGLVERRVGRGSFVRGDGGARQLPGMLPASYSDPLSLAMNFPAPLALEAAFEGALAGIRRDGLIDALLNYEASRGHTRHRDAMAAWLRARGAVLNGEALILTCGAQQAVATTLFALARPGETVLCEALSYSGLKSAARLHGIHLAGLAMDAEGLLPEALDEACRQRLGRLLFCMPTVHNPTTRSQSPARRAAIAALIEKYRLTLIEDDLYLPPGEVVAPLQALIPQRTVYLSSLSKCVAPGLRIGAIAAPPALLPDLVAAAQACVWMASPLSAEIAARWIDSGEAAQIQSRRAIQNAARQAIACDCLRGLRYESAAHNTHLWLRAPLGWGGEEFASALAARGVTVTPPGYFAIGEHADDHLRLSIGQPAGEDDLRRALSVIAEVAGGRRGRMDIPL